LAADFAEDLFDRRVFRIDGDQAPAGVNVPRAPSEQRSDHSNQENFAVHHLDITPATASRRGFPDEKLILCSFLASDSPPAMVNHPEHLS
jgi:hypothetical protein